MRFKVRTLAMGESDPRDEIIEAADVVALRAAFQAQGRIVLDVRRAARAFGLAKRPMRGQFALFAREVRTLIAAGMTIVEAAETLTARERQAGRSGSLAAALLARLLEGHALSAALGELPDAPPVLIAAVRAGERTSNLVEALDDYLRFHDLVEQLRRKVLSAAIYPALVTALGVGISLFLLLVVMPNFARMYQNLRGSGGSSGATLMIQFSSWVSEHRGGTLAGLALLATGLGYWIASGHAQSTATRWARSVPWIHSRIQDFQLAMMYQALALLLKGGYPMLEAMQVAGHSALSHELRASMHQAMASVEQGGLVSEALSRFGLADEVARRLMAAAERNGDFHTVAQVLARWHGERFELFVERLTRVVEPVLLLIVALGVGTIVVAMYLPVFDVATQLR